MKKLFLIPVLFFTVLLANCSKSAMDMTAPSKVDELLTQMKSEPKFLEMLKYENAALAILTRNISKTPNSDSSTYRKFTRQQHFQKNIKNCIGKGWMTLHRTRIKAMK
jgi:hypothetical protein